MESENNSSTKTVDSDEICSTDSEKTNIPVVPSYNKSYCRTSLTTSVFEHVWQLDRFAMLYKNMTTIQSEFSEKVGCKFEIRVFHTADTVIKFYIHTEKPLRGICDLYVIQKDKEILCTLNSCITNGSCLHKTTAQRLSQYTDAGNLVLNFKITIFHDIVTEVLYMKPVDMVVKEKKYNNLTSEEASLCPPYVIFEAKEKLCKISKQLLCATKSSYFLLVCKLHEKENEDEDITVTVDDISDNFLTMLTFIRTDTLPESLSCDKILELLMLAHRYDVKDLKLACEKCLIHNITVGNAVKYLDIAMKLKANLLREHVTGFIKFHLNEFTKIDEFEQLSRSHLQTMIKSFAECKIGAKYVPIANSESL